MLNLDTNNHAVFDLNYHLILVVKYRRQVLADDVMAAFATMASHIGEAHGVVVKECNSEKDHVRLLLRTKPNTHMSVFVNSLKGATSRVLKRQFPAIRKKLWKECLWSGSYCLITVGGAPSEVVRQYIESQGEGQKGCR
jgi:putative transposase